MVNWWIPVTKKKHRFFVVFYWHLHESLGFTGDDFLHKVHPCASAWIFSKVGSLLSHPSVCRVYYFTLSRTGKLLTTGKCSKLNRQIHQATPPGVFFLTKNLRVEVFLQASPQVFLSLAFYATLEECYAPGRFDLFCNSHQLLVGTQPVKGIRCTRHSPRGVLMPIPYALKKSSVFFSPFFQLLLPVHKFQMNVTGEKRWRSCRFWSFSPCRFRPRLWHCFIYIAIAGYAEATWHLKKNCSSSWNESLLCGLPLEYRFLSIHHTHPTLPTNPDTYESPKIMKHIEIRSHVILLSRRIQ